MGVPSILLIDDDSRLIESLKDYLEAQGFVVYTGQDGMHALPLALARRPSLIIMDVDMPVMDGLMALTKLRAEPKTRSIPVIMLTGVVSSRVYPAIEMLPNVSHIKKPVRPEDLLSMIHHYVPESA